MGHCWSSVLQRNIPNVFSSRLHLPMCPSKCCHIHPLIHQRELVIRCQDLEGISDVEILENLSSQDVTDVRRKKDRQNNELVPTNTYVLTFCASTLPKSIKAGYLNIPFEPFVPNPFICYKCQT